MGDLGVCCALPVGSPMSWMSTSAVGSRAQIVNASARVTRAGSPISSATWAGRSAYLVERLIDFFREFRSSSEVNEAVSAVPKASSSESTAAGMCSLRDFWSIGLRTHDSAASAFAKVTFGSAAEMCSGVLESYALATFFGSVMARW